MFGLFCDIFHVPESMLSIFSLIAGAHSCKAAISSAFISMEVWLHRRWEAQERTHLAGSLSPYGCGDEGRVNLEILAVTSKPLGNL